VRQGSAQAGIGDYPDQLFKREDWTRRSKSPQSQTEIIAESTQEAQKMRGISA
jgi:hypothetical protein